MTSTVARSLTGLVVVAGLTVAAFAGFLGRDTTKTLDPVTNQESGPWSTTQVAGCLLTLLVVLVAAVLLRVPPLVAAGAMTVAFATAWTVSAARGDDSGFFLVGAAGVLIAMALGTGIVAFVTARLSRS
jgi:hypothetical protein